MTAEELRRLPADGMRHELVEGELRTMPPSGGEHGITVVNITTPLANHVKSHRLGVVCGAETGFYLRRDPDTVRAPDTAFIRAERVAREGVPKSFWKGGPDLAVEVMSPDDRVMEVEDKVQEWLAGGALLVWVINPRRKTVTVHRPGANPVVLSQKDTLEGGDVVPGFQCPVAAIFP